MAYPGRKIQRITQCALFSAVICLLSPWCVTVGTVPITLSLFAVVLTGSILSPGMALVSVCVYILIGAVGVPVFSGFQGGPATLINLTGGFIWSYIPVVVLISICQQKGAIAKILLALIALIVCYLIGTMQYMLITGTKSLLSALGVCVAPFAIFDIIKFAVAAIIGDKIRTVLKKQNLL